MEKISKVFAFLSTLFFAPIVYGFVFCKLWGWFIVSTFELNPLRIIEAIGIMFFINFIKAQSKEFKPSSSDFWEVLGEVIMEIIIYALLALFMGWIAHLFY